MMQNMNLWIIKFFILVLSTHGHMPLVYSKMTSISMGILDMQEKQALFVKYLDLLWVMDLSGNQRRENLLQMLIGNLFYF